MVTQEVYINTEFFLINCKGIFITYYSHPGYFGKVGMRWLHRKPCVEYCPTLNLEKLWAIAGPEVLEAAKKAKGTKQAPVIDLVKAV